MYSLLNNSNWLRSYAINSTSPCNKVCHLPPVPILKEVIPGIGLKPSYSITQPN